MALLIALAGLAASALARTFQERASIKNADRSIAHLGQQVSVLSAQNATLARRVAATNARLAKTSAGVAPLAGRILKSVFTVETASELGTAWAAWTTADATYLITANHVVASAVSSGDPTVSIAQKSRKWAGRVVKTDPVNDLALVRVAGHIGTPLWPTPRLEISPLPGDELLLVGSPYGLEGTVTTGVVSRVKYNEIQTDAAANPGNSGGPAVDSNGDVVGVLLAGGGENLNFAVPIQRACVAIRSC